MPIWTDIFLLGAFPDYKESNMNIFTYRLCISCMSKECNNSMNKSCMNIREPSCRYIRNSNRCPLIGTWGRLMLLVAGGDVGDEHKIALSWFGGTALTKLLWNLTLSENEKGWVHNLIGEGKAQSNRVYSRTNNYKTTVSGYFRTKNGEKDENR